MAPAHVAIIMDGNGRWAQSRKRPRLFGHIRGTKRVREIVQYAGELGIKYLTLYAFSEENWGRPTQEVSVLMKLLEKYLVRERATLMKNNVRLFSIGDRSKLPDGPRRALEKTMSLTSHNTGLQLTFALSYGSRQEIVRAINKLRETKQGVISEDELAQALDTSEMPDPDLIIRTSGEHRLSNFLLWQGAYSEFYVTETLWPDFTKEELDLALNNYSQRERRFGLTSQQVSSEANVQ
ncbi:MAG: isoprenyl transferase [Oligoflexia bacterium]|nr:isoprenyl transferase [Oligoflexia bacterium]